MKPSRHERGMILVTSAVAMVGLLVIAALAIDLSVVRQNRQANKSAADQAVMAGLRGLETRAGVPLPWQGVCQALDYLKANDPELASMTGSFSAGDGSTPKRADETTDNPSPCVNPLDTVLCRPGATNTWAWYHGTVGPDRIVVDIKSGYETPDSEFDEDNVGSYKDDDGAADLDGCDQLAIIVRENAPTFFGSIVGSDGHQTVTRSVGRVTLTYEEPDVIALLLLEQRACRALFTNGNSTYVLVKSGYDRPGLIHANSTGEGCGLTGSQRVVDGGSSCPAINNCVGTGPSIVAEGLSGEPGRVGMSAVGGAYAVAAHTSSCPDPTSPLAGCTVAPNPVFRLTLDRYQVDQRYFATVKALDTTAAATYGLNVGPADAAGYAVFGPGAAPSRGSCNSLANTTVTAASVGGRTKIFLNCNLSIGPTETFVFDDTITDVVVKGTVDVKGTLDVRNVRTFYVAGSGATGISVQGRLLVNTRGAATCQDRFALNRNEVTNVVVGTGSLSANAAGTVLRLCNAFVYLGSGTLPIDPVSIDLYPPGPDRWGAPPYNNAFTGSIDVGSSATLDWKAPNRRDVRACRPDDTAPCYDPAADPFEDLALWSETSGNCSAGGAGGQIGGQGAVTATGVFFMPNACPFKIAGGGSGARIAADAQFIVRMLELTGTVALEMAPNPANAIPIPKFDGFILTR